VENTEISCSINSLGQDHARKKRRDKAAIEGEIKEMRKSSADSSQTALSFHRLKMGKERPGALKVRSGPEV
jgi:hypothetical protein